MIVKNEARVIERCLRSVKPYIQRWVIVDTGSTDDTQKLTMETLADVPGEVIERPWVDFGHNRSEAVALAREAAGNVGYILVIDADDTFNAPGDWVCPELNAEGYSLRHKMNDTAYYRAQIFSAALPWEYTGVVHEYPRLRGERHAAIHRLEDVWIQVGFDGARRQTTDSVKYLRDAELLAQASENDPTDLRTLFYLAQSYRDAGEFESALKYYQQRAENKGWEEERWYAQYQVGAMLHKLGLLTDAVAAFELAFKERPHRREPVVALATLHRIQYNWSMAYVWSHFAATAPCDVSKDQLFIDQSCHEDVLAPGWRVLDELALALHHIGDPQRAARVTTMLLASPTLPPGEVPRLTRHLQYLDPCPSGIPYDVPTDTRSESTAASKLYNDAPANTALSYRALVFLDAFLKLEGICDTAVVGDDLFVASALRLDAAVALIAADSSRKPESQHELVVVSTRKDQHPSSALPVAWTHTRPGGWLLLLDMQNWGYRHKVETFLGLVEHKKFNIHPHTYAEDTSFCWLIQKPTDAQPS